ncbi:hypothetical protein [Microbacterium sp. HJ5]
MKKSWRALIGVAVAALTVATPLIAAPAAVAANEAVVVCKYTHTPGEGEVLQVVIEPDESSLGEGFAGTFPYEFTDAHFRSVAIGYADQGLDITDCPGYQPEQPDDEPLHDGREDSFCTMPLNGTRTTVVEERSGVRTYVWDGDSWNPQDTWGEWVEVSTTVTDDPACAPLVVVLPALFDAGATPPTCEDPGALPALGTFANVTLTWDRPFDGPGTYTLTASTAAGYTFPDGTTVKTKTFVVLDAIGYQSEDPEAPCYQEDEEPPVPVVLATPTIDDPCGTEDDVAELPAASAGVTYQWLDDEDPTETDVIALIAQGYEVTAVPAGWEEADAGVYLFAQADLTDVRCPIVAGEPPTTVPPPAAPPTAVLSATGGGDVPPALPLAALAALLLGIVAVAYRAASRRA